LLSRQATAAVGSAFNTLTETVKKHEPTLEDEVRETLRPMLKSWLDENLPRLVEQMVQAEIERVTRGRKSFLLHGAASRAVRDMGRRLPVGVKNKAPTGRKTQAPLVSSPRVVWQNWRCRTRIWGDQGSSARCQNHCEQETD
jgi:hypothetical protein